MKHLPKFTLDLHIIESNGHFSPIVMFTDVSVAFKGTEHSALLANCFPPTFQDKLPLRLPF